MTRQQQHQQHAADFKKWIVGRKINFIDSLHGFAVGDKVTYTDDYGVKFEGHTILAIDADSSFYERQFYLDSDAYWFPKKLSELKKEV